MKNTLGIVGAALLLIACGDSGGEGGGATGGSGQGGGGTTTSTTTTSSSSSSSSAGGGGQGGAGGQGQGGAVACEDTPTTALGGDECDAYAEAFCDQLGSCTPALLEFLFGTDASCRAQIVLTCDDQIAQEGDPNTLAEYETCSETFINAACGCTVAEACGEFDDGTLADDDLCKSDAQCAGGACLDYDDFVSCGYCATLGQLDDSCAVNPCADGLYCETDTDTCETLLADAADCDDDDECASDYCTGGVCAQPLPEGDPCDPDDDGCDGLAGLYCDEIDAQCEPFPIAAEDGACGIIDLDTSEFAFCPGHQYCDDPDEDFMGTCTDRIALDGDCTGDGDALDSNCAWGLWCIDGTCAVPDPIDCSN